MAFDQERTDLSLVSLLSKLPLPQIPAGVDAEIRQYLVGLHNYIGRVISTLTPQAIARGLPEVPDLTKKYHLIFDPADKLIKWEEIT